MPIVLRGKTSPIISTGRRNTISLPIETSRFWPPVLIDDIYSHNASSPMNVYTRQSSKQSRRKVEEENTKWMRKCVVDLDMTMMDDEDEEETDRFDEGTLNSMQNADYAILRHSSSKAWEVDIMGTFEKHDDPYHQYLHAVPCYDLAPVNGSIAYMDSNLTLHVAFVSLIESGQQAALVWNEEQKRVVAMLTYTDFLDALLHADSVDRDDVHKKALPYFSEIPNRQLLPLTTVNVTTKVWDVAHRLLNYHVHRMPVMELASEGHLASETDILFMVTLKHIFFESFMKQLGTVSCIAPYMSKRIDKERIGTWSKVHTISESVDLRSAVRLLLENGLSSLPVLDGNGRPTTVLTKRDVIMLLAAQAQSTYKLVLNMPVSAAVSYHKEDEKTLAFCSPIATIGAAINQLLQDDNLQCLFALDDQGHVVAAVSVSDLMSYVLSSALDRSETTSVD